MAVFCAEAEVSSATHRFNILIKWSPAVELLSQYFKKAFADRKIPRLVFRMAEA